MAAGAASSRRDRVAAWLENLWRTRGVASTALVPLAFLFGAVTFVRRRLYRHRLLASGRLPVPVVVVGNWVVGGAGKTPAVIAVVALLRRHGYVPGVVSRGYGRSHDGIVIVGTGTVVEEAGDEPLLLHRRTRAPVVVGRDRVGAAHALLQAHPEVDVVVSDDGLQHLALEREVEVIVIDERGSGNGRLLPAGPLREAMPRRTAPGQLVLYNAEAPTTRLPGFVGRRRLSGLASLADWWRGAPADPTLLATLLDRPLLAAAGVARPERFFAMLREAGFVITPLALPDHHDFAALPWPTATGDVVVTEKDAVKLRPDRRLGARVWVAALDFSPDPAFEAALLALLPPPASRTTPEPHGNTPA